MLVEKKLSDALHDHEKGKKVVVLQEFEDGSLYACPIDDYFDGKTHFLVDVPAYENPEWNKAVVNMMQGSQDKSKTELSAVLTQPEEEEKTPNFSGGGYKDECP